MNDNQSSRKGGAGSSEAAGAWCIRMAGAPLEPAEQADFDAWLAADAAHPPAFERALAVWGGLHAMEADAEVIAMRAEALEAMRDANAQRWARRPPRRAWHLAMATAACLLLALTIALWPGRSGPVEYATGLGERRTFMLEDGSRLSLDAETRVAVDLADDRRMLHLLAGRTKFDVEKDAARPFTVTAGGRTVVATGTAFSVELLGDKLHVILYEGSVAVVRGEPPSASRLLALKRSPGKDAIALVPGRELVATVKAPVAPTIVEADVARSLAWEGGQLSFVDEPLGAVAERLNRYSRAKISIGDARAAAIEINGVFNAGDTNAFLDAAQMAYPLEVRREGGTVILASKPR